MVAYGYQSTPSKMIHVNFGWGAGFPDKYIPSDTAITSTNVPGVSPDIIGMNLISVVTIPL